MMGWGTGLGIRGMETLLWESFQLPWPKGTLLTSLPLAWDKGHGWGGGIQPDDPSAVGTHRERVSLQGFRGQQQSGPGRQMSSHLITFSAFSPLGASRWPCPVPPQPCATAGWGSWGWDLLPVTNHIARDFQPTLSPASGAITTATEDAARGWGGREPCCCLRLAWGAGLSCL